MKALIISIFLILSLSSYSLSFKEYSLSTLIEVSDHIVIGEVIDTFSLDSISKKEITRPYNREKFHHTCNRCNKVAKVVIFNNLKSNLTVDTISVLYHYSIFSAIPPIPRNFAGIFFLNKIDSTNYYIRSTARFSIKDSNENYLKFIKEYLNINKIEDSIVKKEQLHNWNINLSIDTLISIEGVRSFKYYKGFSELDKKKLTNGLKQFNFDKHNYQALLNIVISFSKNDTILLKKCLDKLVKIDAGSIYEGYDLMVAINKLKYNKKGIKLINKFYGKSFNYNSISKEEQLKLITKFVNLY